MLATFRWVLAASLLVPASYAQSPFDTSAVKWTSWPAEGLGSGGPLSRLVTGDFNSDRHLDAVLVQGDAAGLLCSPEQYQQLVTIPGVTFDVDTVERTVPGGADSLVRVNGAGLERISFRYDAGWIFEPIAAGPWQGARRVISRRTTQGRTDIAGVTANGLDLIVTKNALEAPTTSVVWTAPGPIFDIAWIDWQGDGASEILVVHAGGIDVRSDTGAEIFAQIAPLESGIACVFSQLGFAPERAAVLLKIQGLAGSLLQVFDGNDVEPYWLLGNVGPTGITAGDIDGDQDDDLLVTWTFDRTAPYLRNVSDGNPPDGSTATFAFEPGGFLDLGIGVGPNPEQSGEPALGDFDGDGDLDALVPVPAADQVGLYTGLKEDANEHRVSVDSALGEYRYTFDWDQGPAGTLSIPMLAPLTPLASATDLEIVTWSQPAFGQPLDPLAKKRQLLALPAAFQSPCIQTFSPVQPWMPTVWSLEARLVERDGMGRLISAGPTLTLAVSIDQDSTEGLLPSSIGPQILLTFLELGSPPNGLGYLEPPGGFGGERVIGSGLTPLLDPPDFDDEDFPDPDQ
ncbi:MAG: hypothetical protein RL885_17390 [Planctomycetota bacterium]